MALDRNNIEYYYNLGRLTAIVEKMNGLNGMFITKVTNNPKDALEYQIRRACRNTRHILYNEFMSAYENIYKKDLDSQMIEPISDGRVFIGYYHEKSYIDHNFKVLGSVEIEIRHYEPNTLTPVTSDNTISELKK